MPLKRELIYIDGKDETDCVTSHSFRSNKCIAGQILDIHIKEWGLTPDGDRFQTHSSILQPVLHKGLKAMIKIPLTPDEKAGSKMLDWWDGIGAVKVIRSDDVAILMERIVDNHSLKSMSLNGNDNESTRIICEVAKSLHSNRNKPLPELVPLHSWFNDLFLSANRYGGLFPKAAEIALTVLEDQTGVTVLHGDLHHDNILYSLERGWLAIDPKGLLGDRTFDYVNILRNPSKEIALSEGRFMKQIMLIGKNAGIEINHLLKWTIAWSGLSAVWYLNDHTDADLPVEILKMAHANLR